MLHEFWAAKHLVQASCTELTLPKKDVFPNLICWLNFLKTPEPQLQYQVVHGKQGHTKKELSIDDERGGHGAEAKKWL